VGLPSFTPSGDLPVGIHPARLEEVIARFGPGTPQRMAATQTFLRVYELAKKTGHLQRLVLFGSYVSTKTEPNDVDIILVMEDDFDMMACDPETRVIFDHQRVENQLGASVFWARPGHLFRDTVDQFLAYWQIKRDYTLRGLVEVVE
jgi:hypothetical protein